MVATSKFSRKTVARRRISLPGAKNWICCVYVLTPHRVQRIFASDHFSTPRGPRKVRGTENLAQNEKLENRISVGIFGQAFCRVYTMDCIDFSCILELFVEMLSRKWILVFFCNVNLPKLLIGVSSCTNVLLQTDTRGSLKLAPKELYSWIRMSWNHRLVQDDSADLQVNKSIEL